MASFHAEVVHALRAVGVHSVDISHAHPFDLPETDRRFADDTEHATYAPAAVIRWQVLSQVNLVLEEFAGRYSGKTSPVHHFWHTFDIALTRFADTKVDQPPSNDAVTREAHSREVICFGLWFGDPTVPGAGVLLLHRPGARGRGKRTAASTRSMARTRHQPPRGSAVRPGPHAARPQSCGPRVL